MLTHRRSPAPFSRMVRAAVAVLCGFVVAFLEVHSSDEHERSTGAGGIAGFGLNGQGVVQRTERVFVLRLTPVGEADRRLDGGRRHTVVESFREGECLAMSRRAGGGIAGKIEDGSEPIEGNRRRSYIAQPAGCSNGLLEHRLCGFEPLEIREVLGLSNQRRCRRSSLCPPSG